MVPESLSCGDALLLGRDDVAGEHRQHRAVHRHRDADLVERDPVEQDLHVLDRVDRHAGLADVAGHARMVAVVAAVGRQVEGDADALPAAGQRLAVEGVRLLGGREARVLADRPRPHRVHRRLRAAHVGREARQRVGVRQALQVGRGVERLDDDAFGRLPGERVEVAARRRARGGGAPGGAAPGIRRRKSGSSGRRSGGGASDYRGAGGDNRRPCRSPVVSLVAAVARDGGIGHRGELLVHLPDDLRRFKRMTLGSPVVMGRKTWESIGRPLPGRRNIVVTPRPGLARRRRHAAASLDAALALAGAAPSCSSSAAPRSTRSPCRSPTSWS